MDEKLLEELIKKGHITMATPNALRQRKFRKKQKNVTLALMLRSAINNQITESRKKCGNMLRASTAENSGRRFTMPLVALRHVGKNNIVNANK